MRWVNVWKEKSSLTITTATPSIIFFHSITLLESIKFSFYTFYAVLEKWTTQFPCKKSSERITFLFYHFFGSINWVCIYHVAYFIMHIYSKKEEQCKYKSFSWNTLSIFEYRYIFLLWPFHGENVIDS